jgi:glycosyltransferase involved in cell wall biosynthesis
MKNISIIIIAKNEEENLKRCLENSSWANEIILVDSGSTDNTLEIAKNFNVKIYFNKWEGFSAQKKYALSKANNEWVLSVDADEVISKELQIEIENLDESIADGFYIRRENYFLGKMISSCGWENDYQLRLFRKSKTLVTNSLVHEGFVVDGKSLRLNSRLFHYTNKNLAHSIEKINLYSSLAAREKDSRKKVTGFSILLHTLSAFLRSFISLKGYKDGMHGLLISWLNALTSFQTYSKTWELQKKQQRQ